MRTLRGPRLNECATLVLSDCHDHDSSLSSEHQLNRQSRLFADSTKVTDHKMTQLTYNPFQSPQVNSGKQGTGQRHDRKRNSNSNTLLLRTEWWFWEVTCFRAGVFGASSLAAHTVGRLTRGLPGVRLGSQDLRLSTWLCLSYSKCQEDRRGPLFVAFCSSDVFSVLFEGVSMGYAARAGALLGEGRGRAAKKASGAVAHLFSSHGFHLSWRWPS